MYISMYERQNVPLNFLVQRMRIIILKKTESMTGISASSIIKFKVAVEKIQERNNILNEILKIQIGVN